jgi:FG-GAP repeat
MKQLFSSLLLLLILCSTTATRAQLGMGGQPHSSAVLDLKSPGNDKAFYPPRLTTAQRTAMASPQVGALVYDADKGTLFLYDGQNWLPLTTTDLSLLAPVTRTASDGANADYFGWSVAISGDYAIVGAWYKTISGNTAQGAAYIFVRSGSLWTQQAQLTASDGAANDGFGRSVAISGDYAIVGALNDDNGSNADQGSAYIFVRSGTTWSQQNKITANDGAANDGFGRSVAISGNYAIVGAHRDGIGSNAQQGSAYVFNLTFFFLGGNLIYTWSQQAKLIATDGAAYDLFGISVAISGDYALIGAQYADIGSNADQGAAYVFVRSGRTWAQQAKFAPGDGAESDWFGESVAISGDYAVIGASHDDVSYINFNSDQGSAYIFARSGTTWTLQAKLTASDGAARDFFGTGVAISGDYAIVGAAYKKNGDASEQGAAYVFKRSGTGWSQQRKITDNSPAYTQNGQSVGLSNGSFIIGGPYFQGKGKVSFGTID